jgi:hypothetical protein
MVFKGGLAVSKIIFIFVISLVFVMTPLACDRQGLAPLCPDFSVCIAGALPYDSRDKWGLSEYEVKLLQDKALKGSPEAAYRLYFYYAIYRKDHSEKLYWVRIAAENGYPGGEYALGFELRNDPDPRNRQRARFWLKRAAKHGEKLAASLLKELPEEP